MSDDITGTLPPEGDRVEPRDLLSVRVADGRIHVTAGDTEPLAPPSDPPDDPPGATDG